MSVLDKILNGTYEAIIVNEDGFTEEATSELLKYLDEHKDDERLACIGQEAERASKACGNNFSREGCGTDCLFAKICKMVREGNHG